MKITCTRCRREAEANPPMLPEGWEGSIHEAVCPGCQSAVWHPHCTSIRAESGYGERVDLEALDRGESTTVTVDGMPILLRTRAEAETLGVAWCDYIDLAVSRTDGDDDWPTDWRCTECGGTAFEWVHPDYQGSGSARHVVRG